MIAGIVIGVDKFFAPGASNHNGCTEQMLLPLKIVNRRNHLFLFKYLCFRPLCYALLALSPETPRAGVSLSLSNIPHKVFRTKH